MIDGIEGENGSQIMNFENCWLEAFISWLWLCNNLFQEPLHNHPAGRFSIKRDNGSVFPTVTLGNEFFLHN